jgi:hypothetical protein
MHRVVVSTGSNEKVNPVLVVHSSVSTEMTSTFDLKKDIYNMLFD